MRVCDLMRTDLKTIAPDATVADAVLVIAESHVSALPVIDSAGRLIGVISTTDILQAEAECGSAEERERLFDATAVREIMTPKPVVIAPDEEVREAARQMLYLEVHRLFVEDDRRLLGVISQSDVIRAVASGKAALLA